MARAQNSPKGLYAKQRIDVQASGSVYFHDYSSSNDLLSANSTGVVVRGKVKLANAQYLSADSTGLLFPTAAAAPSGRKSGKIIFITNSTGTNGIAINTTGTTWSYARMTSVLNTT